MRGTQSAAEFLTQEELFASFVRQAPEGWAQRNFQVVLHCTVHQYTPGPPKIVTWKVW